jgi:DnaK suppressor protein
MTQAELAKLKRGLESRQIELEELLRDRDGIAITSNADVIDQIQHASERDMAIGNMERDSMRLREIRAALERIQAGTFGICLDCEEEISVKRLAAVPWTTSCISCREAADRRGVEQLDVLNSPLLSEA